MPKLPEVTAWSYSRYSLYKRCPAAFAYKHLHKIPEISGPAAERGNVVHAAGEAFIKAPRKGKIPEGYANLKEELTHLRDMKAIAEMPWGFRNDWSWTGKPDWFGPDVWFRMKADAAVVYDDNTGLVADWKTGRKYPDHEDQGMLFGAVSFMRFPQLVEVDVRFWYNDQPKADNELQFTITAAEAAIIRKDWEKKALPMFRDRKFAPTPNDKCRWCNYSKAKGGPCKF